MQLLIEQRQLARAVGVLSRIAPRRPITPVVSSILLKVGNDRVTLCATDLQSFAEIRLSAETHQSGTAAVDAHFLQRVVSTLGETDVAISLSDSGDSLRITAGSAAFRLRTLDAVDFPVQSPPEKFDISMASSALSDLVVRTTFCALDSDEVSPFAGVLVSADSDSLTMAATDSYQLAHYRLSAVHRPSPDRAKPLEAVVPTQGLTALTRALASLGGDEVSLAWDERSMWIVSDAVAWRMRRLELQYPNLSRYTGPLAGIRIETSRDALLEAVRQVSSIADEARAVGLRVDVDRLHMFTSHREVGEAQAVVTLGGDHPRSEVWIDARRFTNALRAQPSDEIALYLSEPLAPVAIAPAKGEPAYRTILTPLRRFLPEAEAF